MTYRLAEDDDGDKRGTSALKAATKTLEYETMKRVAKLTRVLLRLPSFWIFILALAVRVAWVSRLSNTLTWPDEHEYAAIARGLADGQGYVSTSFRANPVLPFYLSLVFRVWGENYFAARLGQGVLGATTCVLLYGLGKRLGDKLVGVAAGLMLAVYPFHIYLSGVFYPEYIVTFLAVLSVYLAVHSAPGGRPLFWGTATGIVLALTALTRGTFMLYIPCVCFSWLYKAGEQFRRRLRLCGAVLLSSALVLVPWMIRNHHVFGRWMPVSSGSGTMLWRGNNPLAAGDRSDNSLRLDSLDWQQRLEQLPADKREAVAREYDGVIEAIRKQALELGDEVLAADDVLRPRAARYMAAHPVATLRRMGHRLLAWFSALTETGAPDLQAQLHAKWVAAITFYPVSVLALGGAFLSFPRRRELMIVYLAIASITLVHIFLTVTTRYRLPLDPFLLLFAGVTIAAGWRSFKTRYRRTSEESEVAIQAGREV